MKGKAKIEKKNKALQTLEIEYILANTIKPNSYNPNRQSDHDFFLLIKSMLEDGFTQPIIVQRADNTIVDGEHRWTGWITCEYIKRNKIDVDVDSGEAICAEIRYSRLDKLKGMPDLKLPVVFTDMTPEQMRIATLRHNRARGSEDYELTAAVLRDLRELGALDWAQDSLMMDDVELQRLIDDVPAPEALAGEEFNEAWQPSSDEDGQGQHGNAETSMTPEAIEEMRRQERKIAAAKTEEERVAAQKDTDIYRVSYVFSGDEAKLVKEALGDKPAVKLLELCQAALKGSEAAA